MHFLLWPALLLGGFLCGIVNAAAGGGSFLTLPLLMALGLPPQVANATNRVAITLQCAAGVGTYHRSGVRPWRHLPPVALVAVPGSLLGAFLAARAPEGVFRPVAAALMLIMAAAVVVKPGRWNRPRPEPRVGGRLLPLFFLIGIYGGFLQAGAGVLMISAFVLGAGFDVVHGNALKFSLALSFTAAALLLFAGFGQVRWLIGLLLAVGTVAGGIVGARLVMLRGAAWVRGLVLLSALAAAAKLLWR
ncbi:MAG: sulfite exporter TauE/SafE family protein [Candidatus Krumholzibacteriia bacterium]